MDAADAKRRAVRRRDCARSGRAAIPDSWAARMPALDLPPLSDFGAFLGVDRNKDRNREKICFL